MVYSNRRNGQGYHSQANVPPIHLATVSFCFCEKRAVFSYLLGNSIHCTIYVPTVFTLTLSLA